MYEMHSMIEYRCRCAMSYAIVQPSSPLIDRRMAEADLERVAVGIGDLQPYLALRQIIET